MSNKILFILFLFLTVGTVSRSQDVLCNVEVTATQVEGSERSMFEAMQRALYEFVNNRKWTSDKFKQQERIEFNILINITSRISTDRYKATIQVQSRRPVYGSSYNSTLLNHQDENFEFTYNQFEVLDFSEQATLSQLTSVIAYYTYLVIGLDYDSFSPRGGTEYFQKALNIVNQNATSQESGWKAFESQNNRFWLITNMLDNRFFGLRDCMYEYHRLGLDYMSDNTDNGRTAIVKALLKLKTVHTRVPNSFNMRVFFNAKADEIVNIMKEAEDDEKRQVIELLNQVDLASTNKWSKINGR